jgi:hypothetical protein
MFPIRWKAAAAVTVGLFGAGIAVGYVAHRRGVPQDQVGRWLLKEATRKALHAYDAARDWLPDGEVLRADEALGEDRP